MIDYKSPPGLRTEGSKATVIIPLPDLATDSPFWYRRAMRIMGIDEFTATRGSGTLRKNKSIGMNVASHALHERVAYEYGYYFETCPERFVTWGEARSEGDCKPVTEAGWFIERYASVSLFPGDEVETKYITVERDGEKREGIGIVVRKTSVTWLPSNYIVFCIIAEWDHEKDEFKAAVNPC